MILKSNPVVRDLVLRHVGPFLLCFFSIMFILLLQFLILHVDKLIGKGLPAGVVLELIVTNLAYMVVMAVPMAVMVATLIAYGRFSEWNEWTALRAAGVHPWRLMLPVVTITLAMGAALTLFSNFVLPEANQRARSLFIDIRLKKPGFDLREGAFYDGITGYTFLVRRIDNGADTDTLRDIVLYQREGADRYRATVKAEKGVLTSEGPDLLTLMLHNGSIVRLLPSDSRQDGRVESSTFSRYRIRFDLSELAFSRSSPERRGQNDRTMSVRAMRVVMDSLDQRMREDRSRLERKSIAILQAPAPRVWTTSGRSAAASDTLAPFPSELAELWTFPDPVTQNQALNRIVSNLEQYRMDLDNHRISQRQNASKIAAYQVEIHKKSSIPFACVLFALIGAPIGLLTRKGNIGLAAVISSALLTLYFVGVIQGEKLADRLFITPWWGMWGVNVLYGTVAAVLLWVVRQPLRSPTLLPFRLPWRQGEEGR